MENVPEKIDMIVLVNIRKKNAYQFFMIIVTERYQ